MGRVRRSRGRRRWRGPHAGCPVSQRCRGRWRRRRRRLSGVLVACLLLLFKELDNEVLVRHDELVVEPLLLEVVAKVLPPLRVECVEDSELGLGSVVANGAVEAAR